MASLQGLPPLPRSLHGLLQAGSAHWKEQERILQIRASIQQDIIETQSREWGGMTNGDSGGSPSGSRRTTVASLQATLSHLRREMVSLRQLDMSLLCQLWSLNESIQEYKHLVGDRISETNSECSNYSLENGLDTIPSIEEEHDLDLLSSSMDESSERIFEEASAAIGPMSGVSGPAADRKPRPPLTPPVKAQRSRTPPKQRPKMPPPAAPRAPDSPTPPPRTRTPPTKAAAAAAAAAMASGTTPTPPLPSAPPPLNRTPPSLPSAPPPSLSRTPSLSQVGSTSNRTPSTAPHHPTSVNRPPPPRNACSTPPLPQAPPPVHRTPPTKRLTTGPQAPPRRNRNTPPRNSQSSPSLSQRSSFSTCSNRSSAYGSDC